MVKTKSISQFDELALQRRLALTRTSGGPAALVQNVRVFLIASFACIGGLLYGYNQGVFSGVLTMTAFKNHMGVYTSDQTKKGWLTSILELGAWTGTLYSGFLAELISRKYAIIVNTGVFILGVIIQCTATTAAGHSSILGGRFIVGMGVGSLSMASLSRPISDCDLAFRYKNLLYRKLAEDAFSTIIFYCATNRCLLILRLEYR